MGKMGRLGKGAVLRWCTFVILGGESEVSDLGHREGARSFFEQNWAGFAIFDVFFGCFWRFWGLFGVFFGGWG